MRLGWLVGTLALVAGGAFAVDSCEIATKGYPPELGERAAYLEGLRLFRLNCYREAKILWEVAADEGDTDSLVMLGFLYHLGDGPMEPDKQKAFLYFLQAAEAGNNRGMVMTASHYAIGDRNPDKAWMWYIRAAEKGERMAMEKVALVYRKGGLGQKVDPEKAAMWEARLTL